MEAEDTPSLLTFLSLYCPLNPSSYSTLPIHFPTPFSIISVNCVALLWQLSHSILYHSYLQENSMAWPSHNALHVVGFKNTFIKWDTPKYIVFLSVETHNQRINNPPAWWEVGIYTVCVCMCIYIWFMYRHKAPMKKQLSKWCCIYYM